MFIGEIERNKTMIEASIFVCHVNALQMPNFPVMMAIQMTEPRTYCTLVKKD